MSDVPIPGSRKEKLQSSIAEPLLTSQSALNDYQNLIHPPRAQKTTRLRVSYSSPCRIMNDTTSHEYLESR
ncbi:hypothetical protein BDV12DRAFT_161129 [Aspergillus spectabilis]